MAKDMTLALLYDCYGALLSPRQQELFEGYYNEDLSLSELAEGFGISRQAALQAIHTAEHKLRETEEKLGFCRNLVRTRTLARQLAEEAARLPQSEAKDRVEELTRQILQ